MSKGPFKENTFEICYIKSYDYPPHKDTMLLDSDADYVKACHALRETFSAKTPLKILVRQRSHFIWLRNFAEQIDIGCTFTEKTPRLILADKWNVSIPEWLDDETVISQNLLNLDKIAQDQVRFEETMLVTFLGPALHTEKLEPENLSEIVTAVTKPEVKGYINDYPVLKSCLTEKINAWKIHTNQAWVKEICDGLLGDPEGLWKELTLWTLLSAYPEKLLEYVVPPERVLFLKGVPLEGVRNLPLHTLATEQASTQIEMFYKDIALSIKSSNDFCKVVECTSGKLRKEFHIITGLLASKQFEASQEDITLVRKKFKACPGISHARLATLERFVMPKKPSLPRKDESWTAERWIRWAVDEYIPYRHWQTQNRYYDPELEKAAQHFSDWYMAEYASIHKDSKDSLVHVLRQWENLIKKDALSLILLIDSLPLAFWDIFQDAMTKAGFHRHEMTYRFVPIPSITEVCKPLILSGRWEDTNKSYEAILHERSERDWGDKRVIYLPNLKRLSDLKPPEDPAVVLLNFLPSDDTLHSDVEIKDSTYEEELYRLFVKVANSAKNLLNAWPGKPGQCSVYVITDHGASKILEEEKMSLDSKVISRLFSDERYRFSRVDKQEIESIPENLWALGYRFSQPFMHQDCVYFIPRGHNTVREKGGSKGYIHGGASPEEAIVPAAIFRPVKPAWKELAARFRELKMDQRSGKAVFHIQRVISLKIEVQNPNSEAVNILRVDVLNPDADIKGYTTAGIAGNGYGVVELNCYFNKTAIGEEGLVLQLTYEIAGEEYIKELKSAAEFKSAVSGGFSLKDLD